MESENLESSSLKREQSPRNFEVDDHVKQKTCDLEESGNTGKTESLKEPVEINEVVEEETKESPDLKEENKEIKETSQIQGKNEAVDHTKHEGSEENSKEDTDPSDKNGEKHEEKSEDPINGSEDCKIPEKIESTPEVSHEKSPVNA